MSTTSSFTSKARRKNIWYVSPIFSMNISKIIFTFIYIYGIDFGILVGRKRKPFTWSAHLETATLHDFKSIVLHQYDLKSEFDKEDMSLEFTVNSIGEKYKPVSDSDFRDMLRRLVDRLVSQFTVAISTPS